MFNRERVILIIEPKAILWYRRIVLCGSIGLLQAWGSSLIAVYFLEKWFARFSVNGSFQQSFSAVKALVGRD
jgi:hypothetical protein